MNRLLVNALCWLLLLGILPAFALAASDFSIAPSGIMVQDGDSFVISIAISTTDSVAGVQLNLDFNPLLFEALSFADGGFLTSDNTTVIDLTTVNNSAGTVQVVILRNEPSGIAGSGSLYSITFRSLDIGEGILSLSGISVSDAFGSMLNVSSLNNGSVTVIAQRDVMINEFLPHPSSANDEWVELYNNGSMPVNISSWKINSSSDTAITIPGQTILIAAGRAVFHLDNKLNDSSDVIKLVSSNGNIVDWHPYSLDPGEGISIGRKHDGLSEWVIFAEPTLGIRNNRLPADGIAGKSINEDRTESFSLDIQDPDSDPLSFSVVDGDINKVDCDIAGLNLTLTPYPDWNGIANCTIRVDDGYGIIDMAFPINVGSVNDAPAIANVPGQSATEDISLVLDVAPYISDVDNLLSELEITTSSSYASVLGHIITFNYPNGVLEENVEIRVSDGELESSQNITVNIANTNDNPVLSPVSDKTAVEGLLLAFNLSATDEDPTNDSLVFLTDASIGNLELDSATGLVTFTPDYSDVGTYNVLFGVSDGNGGTDNETITLTVHSALDIMDLDVNVDGAAHDNVGNGTILSVQPGSAVQLSLELKNLLDVSINGVIINATIGTIGLTGESALIPSLSPSETQMLGFVFELPQVIGEGVHTLAIQGRGEDENHVMRRVERFLLLNVSKEDNDVILEDVSITPDRIACVRDAALNLTITNRGSYDQLNGNTIRITNEELSIDITDAFSLPASSQVVKSYNFAGLGSAVGIFPIMINITWFYANTIIEEAELNISRCIDVPDFSTDEDTAPPSDWIDLWLYTDDPNYPDNYFTYGIESQSNDSLINCSISSNRYINCLAPAQDQHGYSDINASVEGSSASFDKFRVTVNAVSDAPVIAGLPDILFSEGSSYTINLDDYVSDIDNSRDELVWTSSANDNIRVNITSGRNAIFSTFDNDWSGNETITLNVADGAGFDSQNISVAVSKISELPYIRNSSPSYDPIIGDNVMQELSIDVANPDSVSYGIGWYVNSILQATGAVFNFTQGAEGIYEVVAKAENSTELFSTRQWGIRVSTTPITTYAGTINDVAASDVNAFTGLTIENGNATIDFGDAVLDLSDVVDVDRNVMLRHGAVGINSDASGFLLFKNYPAWITMRNLLHNITPRIFYNEGFSLTGTSECPSSICRNITYDNGVLRFYAEHFSIFFLPMPNNPPAITSSPVTTAIVNESYSYDVDAADPENDALTYSLTEKPEGMAINSASGLISWIPLASGIYNVTVIVSDNSSNSASQSFSISAKEPSKLKITDLDAKVGEKKSNNLVNGDKITKKAKPGDDVEFRIELKNNYPSRSDIDIEDIELTATISGIDDGDDLEETADIDSLDAGHDRSVKLDFTVPLLVDSDVYDVVLSAVGEDENGTSQEVEWNLKLEVKKDKHALLLSSASLNKRSLGCDRNAILNLKVINIGEEDEDELSIRIKNDGLGININDEGIELAAGTGSDSVLDKSYRISADGNISSGTYVIAVQAYYDGNLADERAVELRIDGCAKVATPVKTTALNATKPVPAAPKAEKLHLEPVPLLKKASFRDSTEYLMLLALFAILLSGIAVLLAGAAIIRLRK